MSKELKKLKKMLLKKSIHRLLGRGVRQIAMKQMFG